MPTRAVPEFEPEGADLVKVGYMPLLLRVYTLAES